MREEESTWTYFTLRLVLSSFKMFVQNNGLIYQVIRSAFLTSLALLTA